MSASASLYGGFYLSLANKQINLNSDAFAVGLLGNTYTPSDSHRYWSDVSAQEITGTGYTAGGKALSGVTASYASNTLTFTASTLQWTSSTITAYYAVVYDTTPGTASTNPLIGYVNFGGAQNDSGGTFQIAWNASGIFQLTHP
jgi:hypothetical protein